jgi:hypothetical protein
VTLEKLSFGIVCRGTTFPAWQAKCILSLIKLKIAEPKVLILKYVKKSPNKRVKSENSPKRKVSKFRINKNLLFSILLKIDKKIFKPKAWTPHFLEDVMGRVPILKCDAYKKRKYSQYFVEESVSMIKEFDLDFILYFDHNIIRGKFLEAAKYGVWSFHHDDEQKYRGGSAGIWEIYFNDKENGVVLQKLQNKLDAGIIIKKKFFSTMNHSISLNNDQLLFGSSELLTEACAELITNTDSFNDLLPSSTKAPIYRRPTNSQTIKLALILLKNNIIRLLNFSS